MPTKEAEDTDPEISAERAHLTRSREALHRMRENVLSLDASVAGDWVSAQVLGQEVHVQYLEGAGHNIDATHRAESDELIWKWFGERL